MSIAQSILEAVQANAVLVAALADRIYSSNVPIGTTNALGPWLSFERISNNQETAHDGDQGLASSRYQFTIGSSDKSILDATRDLLLALNGTDFTAVSGQEITFLHAGDHEDYETETRTYSAIIDFYVWANT